MKFKDDLLKTVEAVHSARTTRAEWYAVLKKFLTRTENVRKDCWLAYNEKIEVVGWGTTSEEAEAAAKENGVHQPIIINYPEKRGAFRKSAVTTHR